MGGLRALLRHLLESHISMTEQQAHELFSEILDGRATDVEIAAVLAALAQRGETADEIVGLVRAMRERILPLPLTDVERQKLVDTCGTGGDSSGTFNISTAAALVAAAAGASVAKHGNRAVTSNCGSADVLEALGVPVDLSPDAAVACLRATGFVFLHAPLSHPAMRRVQPVRRALGFRTLFNLAGPLTNPAGASAQVMGVYSVEKVPLLAEAMLRLGVRHGLVVHGADGLDELTVSAATSIAEVRNGSLRSYQVRPEDCGLDCTPPDALRGGETVAENAAILERILRGEASPGRDVVALNAAAALVVAGLVPDLRHGVEQASHALSSGAAHATLETLRGFAGDL
ncbi:MAG: anthranilate phosphoribosyltransferase [Acidobacteriaceae bacterium]